MRAIETPWGHADSERQRAPGITFYSTPSHGGYHVEEKCDEEIRRLFPSFQPFCGRAGWYEEDEDWAVVALAYSGAFELELLRAAVRTVERHPIYEANRRDGCSYRQTSRWSSVLIWLDSTPAGQRIRASVKEFERDLATMWECGGCGTHGRGGQGWDVYFTRVGDRAQRTVWMPYPERTFYSDAELDELELHEAATPAPAVMFTELQYVDDHSDADPGL